MTRMSRRSHQTVVVAVGPAVAAAAAAGAHIERGGAQLDVSLDDEPHGLLHVTPGDGQGAAGLRQATLGEHLQKVLLLGLPTRHWTLPGEIIISRNTVDG